MEEVVRILGCKFNTSRIRNDIDDAARPIDKSCTAIFTSSARDQYEQVVKYWGGAGNQRCTNFPVKTLTFQTK
jgi:hypothetical protein